MAWWDTAPYNASTVSLRGSSSESSSELSSGGMASRFVRRDPNLSDPAGSLWPPEWFPHQSNSFEETLMIRNALSFSVLSILLLAASGQRGWAASFDCAKAETAD